MRSWNSWPDGGACLYPQHPSVEAGGLGIEARLGLEVRKVTERSMPGKTRQKSPFPPAAGQQRLQEAGLSCCPALGNVLSGQTAPWLRSLCRTLVCPLLWCLCRLVGTMWWPAGETSRCQARLPHIREWIRPALQKAIMRTFVSLY